MLIILSLHHLLQAGSAHALPFPTIAERNSALEPPSASTCHTLGECRTIWNIIWSCLITIFSCTWIAIHPNIPSPKASWLVRTSRRVGITLMALIAPELVILWALRQWLAARKLRDNFWRRGWTMSHGFFAIMGGYMLYDGDEPVRVLLPEDLEQLEREGHIDIPNLTKEEVNDRSKGDLLSKGLVVLQTSWFILQCCARGVQRLPITELEVVTLAYAAVNIVTYAIWFNKPLNVQRSVRIQRKDCRNRTVNMQAGRADGLARKKSATAPIFDFFQDVGEHVLDFFSNASFFGLLVAAIMSPVTPFIGMVMGSMSDNSQPQFRVHTFAGGDDRSVPFAVTFPAACVATVFGAIHCIAWSFKFSSPHEQLLWRTASVATTCLPFVVLVSMYISQEFARKQQIFFGDKTSIWEAISVVVASLASLLYVIARVCILVQAFTSLRALPDGAFETVHWTTFVPHI